MLDARLLVRRNRLLGGLLVGVAAIVGPLGSYGLYRGGLKDTSGRSGPLALGGIDVGVAGLAAGYGLYQLLLREHDVVLGLPEGR